MNIKNQLVKSFLGVGAIRIMAIPVGLATSVLLARFLGPEAFGQYSFVMALMPLLALPISVGMQNLLTREVAACSHAADWTLYNGAVKASHIWAVSVSVVIILIFAILATALGWWSSSNKWGLLPIGMIMLPLLGLNAARNGVIKGLGYPAIAELPITLIQPCIVLAILSYVIFSRGLTAQTAVWVQVVSMGLAFVIASIIFLRVSPSEPRSYGEKYEVKKWGLSLGPFILLSLVGTFNSQLGIISLGFLSSDDQVGALRVAERGAQFVTLSLTIVNLIIGPHIVKAYRSNDTKFLQRLSRQAAQASFLIAIPIGLTLIVFGEQLIDVLFGVEYSEISYMPLVILVVGQLFNAFMGSVGLLLAMTGNERQSLKGQFAAVVVSITLCILLVPKYGAIGAAIAVSIGIVVWNTVLGLLVYKILGIKPSLV